jgi:hypothetical protein
MVDCEELPENRVPRRVGVRERAVAREAGRSVPALQAQFQAGVHSP